MENSNVLISLLPVAVQALAAAIIYTDSYQASWMQRSGLDINSILPEGLP